MSNAVPPRVKNAMPVNIWVKFGKMAMSPKKIAPVKVAILPLVKNKDNIVSKAREVYELLKPHFACQYDEVGAIGRRYRRHDEIGTPFALTIDFDSLENNDVTLRDRDTMEQRRVKIEDLVSVLKKEIYEK